MRRILAIACCALAAAPPASAGAQVVPGGTMPGGCAVDGFGDGVGTDAGEVLVGRSRGERVYGLGGDDWLIGAPDRPVCLFGGPGDDVLSMTDPGGIALGEDGDDVLTGAAGPDALTGGYGADALAGAGGTDVLRGGPGVDGLAGGDGDDLLESVDRRPEVVDCGGGSDTVLADRADVLLGCEDGRVRGAALRALAVAPLRGGVRRVFRLTFLAPHAAGEGGYRVLLPAGCGGGLRQVASVPGAGRTVAAGQRVRVTLRPAAGGWCPGAVGGLVVEQPGCKAGHACRSPLPVAPVGRVVLRVR